MVLGISYKKNTGDIRNTPSEVIIRELKEMGARVYAYDPYVSAEETEKDANYAGPMEIFRDADCIVLVTDHDAFKSIKLDNMKKLAKDRCIIVDGRGFFDRAKVEVLGFEYSGVGRGG